MLHYYPQGHSEFIQSCDVGQGFSLWCQFQTKNLHFQNGHRVVKEGSKHLTLCILYIYDIQSDLMHKSHQNIQILEIADKAILRCFFLHKN